MSFNSRIILDFFLFWNCKLHNRPKNLRLKCQLFTYLTWKGLYIHARDCSRFRFKNAQFQNKKLSQLTTWAHKCPFYVVLTYMYRELSHKYIYASWHSLLTQDWYCSQSVLSTHSASVHWPSSQWVPGYNRDFFFLSQNVIPIQELQSCAY